MSTPQRPCRLDQLPTEILVEVLIFLPPSQVANTIPRVSKLFYAIVFSHYALWSEIYRVNRVFDRYMVSPEVLDMLQSRMDNSLESGHNLKARFNYSWTMQEFDSKQQRFEELWQRHLAELKDRTGVGVVEHKGIHNIMFEFLTTGGRSAVSGAQWMRSQWNAWQRDCLPVLALLIHYFGANTYTRSGNWAMVPRQVLAHQYIPITSLEIIDRLAFYDQATRFPCILRVDLEYVEGSQGQDSKVEHVQTVSTIVDVYRFNAARDTLEIRLNLGNEKVRQQYQQAMDRYDSLKLETTDALLHPNEEGEYPELSFPVDYFNQSDKTVFVEVEGEAYVALRARPYSQAVTVEMWIDVHRLQPVLDLEQNVSIVEVGQKHNPLDVIPIRWQLLCNQYYRGRLANVALSNHGFNADFGQYVLVTTKKQHEDSAPIAQGTQKRKRRRSRRRMGSNSQVHSGSQVQIQTHRDDHDSGNIRDDDQSAQSGRQLEQSGTRNQLVHRHNPAQKSREYYLSNTAVHLLDWDLVAEHDFKYLSRNQLRKRRFHRHLRSLERDPVIATNVVHVVARIVCTSGPNNSFVPAVPNNGGADSATTSASSEYAFLLPIKMSFLHRSQRNFVWRMVYRLRKTSATDLVLSGVVLFWFGVIMTFLVSYIVAIAVGVTVSI